MDTQEMQTDPDLCWQIRHWLSKTVKVEKFRGNKVKQKAMSQYRRI